MSMETATLDEIKDMVKRYWEECTKKNIWEHDEETLRKNLENNPYVDKVEKIENGEATVVLKVPYVCCNFILNTETGEISNPKED